MILSIDGGGTRMYYYAKMLRMVEQVLGEPLAPKFDLLVGNSAGGIIALAMANGMPLSEIVKLSREVLPEIFHRGWLEKATNPGGIRRPLYDNRALRRRLDETFGDTPLGMVPQKVAVTAIEVTKDAALAGRKWWATRIIDGFMDSGMDVIDFMMENLASIRVLDYHRNDEPSHRGTTVIRSWVHKGWSLKEAALATSAAPTYLPGLVRNGKCYIDGGLYANNPAHIALLLHLSGETLSGCPYEPPCIFSVGSPDLGLAMDDASDEAFDAMDEYLNGPVGTSMAEAMGADIIAALESTPER